MTTTPAITHEGLVCYHCGLGCADSAVSVDDHVFCCTGCRTVYEILQENGLDQYYRLEARPGTPLNDRAEATGRFAYLDDDTLRAQLLDYDDGTRASVTLRLPQIHCASCVWLLENLRRLEEAVSHSEVDFLRHELAVTFDPQALSLRGLVERLTQIGYEPEITLESAAPRKTTDDPLIRKIGVAGFCFGNAMLFSLPEYFAATGELSSTYQRLFGALNLALALPVLLYSSQDYLRGAWRALSRKTTTIDVPIALGIGALFGRSLYEILTGVGSGYMDSFTGLVFFLLLGRLFQRNSFAALSFERDYRSYFPLAVNVHDGQQETSLPVAALKPGHHIVARHGELVPADCRMLSAHGRLDLSYVTGESDPCEARRGDQVWAGGRVAGGAIELEVLREVSHSYLTRLWNQDLFHRPATDDLSLLANRFSRWFTGAVLAIASGTAAYWLIIDAAVAAHAVTSVLIIACPCALALSTPFTTGAALNLLSRVGLYLRDGSVVERLARISRIVFDKTGTLTSTRDNDVIYEGPQALAPEDAGHLASLLANSVHPLSRKILTQLPAPGSLTSVSDYHEAPGLGLRGQVGSVRVCAGSRQWLQDNGVEGQWPDAAAGTAVHVAIDGIYRGHFQLSHAVREGAADMLADLRADYPLMLLSGDNDRERQRLSHLFGADAQLRFSQSPQQKLDVVRELEQSGPTLMIGDGLNDAGALKASSVGLAVSEEIAAFSPACDGILAAGTIDRLPAVLRFARLCLLIVMASFGLSLLYNVVGLNYAVRGSLSPLLSAVLMPISSVSIIAFTAIATRLAARWTGIHR